MPVPCQAQKPALKGAGFFYPPIAPFLSIWTKMVQGCFYKTNK